MRAYEFIIEGKMLSQQDKADLQSQADYGGEDPDAPADKYGVQSNQTKQALGRSVTSIGNVDIPDDAWSAGIGSSAAMGSLAGIKSAGKTITSTPANTKAPPVNNSIFPALVGRPKPEDVTHAYRTMKPAELQHAQSTGYFTAKNPENRKWWTAHTANPKGFGGLEKSSEPSIQTQVRVPIGKVPSDTAVHAGHAEYWNRETGQWAPVVSGLPAP